MKKTINFRNSAHKNKSLEMLSKHAKGEYGNTEDKKLNKNHYDKHLENIKKEGLEEEFINN